MTGTTRARRPFLFCRHGDCQKCPYIVGDERCPHECHEGTK